MKRPLIKALSEGTTKNAGTNPAPTSAKPDNPPPAQAPRRYAEPLDREVGSKPLLDPKLKQAIGRVSNLTDTDMERIAAEVKENWRKLTACTKHDFIMDPRVPYQPMRERYVCRACGGTINGEAFRWWQRGMADAKA
jgi:hypothetical protein